LFLTYREEMCAYQLQTDRAFISLHLWA